MFGLFGVCTLLKFGSASASLLQLLLISTDTIYTPVKKLSQMMEAFQRIGGATHSNDDKCIIV